MANKDLKKSRSHLVKVAVQVNGRFGMYQSHRWKNPNSAFNILKQDLRKQGVANPNAIEFIDKKDGKTKNQDEILSNYEGTGKESTIQEFVRANYDVKAKKGTGATQVSNKVTLYNKDIAEPTTMPKLTGSEKQIAWANDIREGIVNNFKTKLNDFNFIGYGDKRKGMGEWANWATEPTKVTGELKDLFDTHKEARKKDKNSKEAEELKSTFYNLKAEIVEDMKANLLNAFDKFIQMQTDSVFWIDNRDYMHVALSSGIKGAYDKKTWLIKELENIRQSEIPPVTPKETVISIQKATYDNHKKILELINQHDLWYGSKAIDNIEHGQTFEEYTKQEKTNLENYNYGSATKKTDIEYAKYFLDSSEKNLNDVKQSISLISDYEDEYKEFDREYDYFDYLTAKKDIKRKISSIRSEIFDGKFKDEGARIIANATAGGRMLNKIINDYEAKNPKPKDSGNPPVTSNIYDDDANPTSFVHTDDPMIMNPTKLEPPVTPKDNEKIEDPEKKKVYWKRRTPKQEDSVTGEIVIPPKNEYTPITSSDDYIQRANKLSHLNEDNFIRATMDMFNLNVPLTMKDTMHGTRGMCLTVNGNVQKISVSRHAGANEAKATGIHESIHGVWDGRLSGTIEFSEAIATMGSSYGASKVINDTTAQLPTLPYIKYIINTMPRLKGLETFRDCKTFMDFGKVIFDYTGEIVARKHKGLGVEVVDIYTKSISRRKGIPAKMVNKYLPKKPELRDAKLDKYAPKVMEMIKEYSSTAKNPERVENSLNLELSFLIEQLKSGSLTMVQALKNSSYSDVAALLLYLIMDEEGIEDIEMFI